MYWTKVGSPSNICMQQFGKRKQESKQEATSGNSWHKSAGLGCTYGNEYKEPLIVGILLPVVEFIIRFFSFLYVNAANLLLLLLPLPAWIFSTTLKGISSYLAYKIFYYNLCIVGKERDEGRGREGRIRQDEWSADTPLHGRVVGDFVHSTLASNKPNSWAATNDRKAAGKS